MNSYINNKIHIVAALYYLIIVLVSIAVYNVFMLIHNFNFEDLSKAALGVIEGKPHWAAYQNRLLGPTIVYIISKCLGLAFSQALKIFYFLMILLQNVFLSFLLN